jgi:E3 ubiquitin-protein ligase RNF213
VVVVFDEIGLAEISPHNPLKVMHSLLEPPRVATVGISNWSLDASKMNRVINLSRTEPSEEDLLQSAIEISKNSHSHFR